MSGVWSVSLSNVCVCERAARCLVISALKETDRAIMHRDCIRNTAASAAHRHSQAGRGRRGINAKGHTRDDPGPSRRRRRERHYLRRNDKITIRAAELNGHCVKYTKKQRAGRRRDRGGRKERR